MSQRALRKIRQMTVRPQGFLFPDVHFTAGLYVMVDLEGEPVKTYNTLSISLAIQS